MAYTPYVSELILDFLFTATVATRPTAWNVALFNGDPEASGVELTDANYARQSVTFTVADADSNGRSEAKNVAAVTFPDMPLQPPWPTWLSLTSRPTNCPRWR